MSFKALLGFVMTVAIMTGLSSCSVPASAPEDKPKRMAEALRPSPDEDALLRMRLALILDKFKNRSYGSVYDMWMKPPASESQNNKDASSNYVSRTRFMHTMYCVDRFLGRMKSYDASSIHIMKDVESNDKNDTTNATFTVRVLSTREQANGVEELFILRQSDLTYTLSGYYVKNDKPGLLDCMNRINFPKPATPSGNT